MTSHSASFVDRVRRWLRRLRPRPRPPPDEAIGTGFLKKAKRVTINGGQFTNEVPSRQSVFELFEPRACLDAIKDSTAQYPPPKCNPDTRLEIMKTLNQWLLNGGEQKIMWVRGSAGSGKSAVAQSFGDFCEEGGILGGSYFFSRTGNRNEFEPFVPTLIYQLATIPEYRSLVETLLAAKRPLLQKSPPVQFRELIIEPFAALQTRTILKPIVIILDGLDECEGEAAQLSILKMITNAIRSRPNLPLRWLIFSRPEPHLKNAFPRDKVCCREELGFDAADVERYVNDRLIEIKEEYRGIVPPEWPSQSQLQALLHSISGLFILASTCLNYIGDSDQADPLSQLKSLLTFMGAAQGNVSGSPLEAVDRLYSQILEKIQSEEYETTRRILAYISHQNKLDQHSHLGSVQKLCNVLRLDKLAFYKAARGLHSVMSIPEPDVVASSQLQFYHVSFPDFLLDNTRSGDFVVSEQYALESLVQLSIYWCQADATNLHTHDEWDLDLCHKHCDLPDLAWVSEDNQESLSQSIAKYSRFCLFDDMQLDAANEGLLSQLSDIDFNCWNPLRVLLLARRFQLNPATSTSIMRVEPSSPTDHRLLEYFHRVVGNGVAKPAKVPIRYELPKDEWIWEYFFLGKDDRSIIVWRMKSPTSDIEYTLSLRCDREPSKAQISKYQEYLQNIHWDEEKAMSGMR